MVRPRKLSDGTLVYPHRGIPPVPKEGYMADPGDPFTHFLTLKPCFHRFEQLVSTSCCTELHRRCAAKDKRVNRLDCQDCDRLPSIGTQITNFIDTLKTSSMTLAKDREERRRICQDCPYRNGKRCTTCGCFIAAKTALADSKCDIGAW